MSQLTTNTVTIDELITMANNLPDAGSGGSGGGSVETCTVTIGADSGLSGPVYCTVLSETGASFNTFTHNYNEVSTIENVICNSILVLKYGGAHLMTISGDGELLETLYDSNYNTVGHILCKSGIITISFAAI